MKKENDNVDIVINDITIRQRLTDIRKKRGLTQQSLAEKANISIGTIGSIESTESNANPQLKNILAYANALGYELSVRKREDTVEDEM